MKNTKYTLLTNLEFVQTGDLRLQCSALLIEEGCEDLPGMSVNNRLRGFGPDPAWPVFTQWFKPDVDTPFYVFEHGAKSENVITRSNAGKERPLFQGTNLIMTGATLGGSLQRYGYFLQLSKAEKPLDVHFHPNSNICEVWEVLNQKTAEYWSMPHMPLLNYGPPAAILELKRQHETVGRRPLTATGRCAMSELQEIILKAEYLKQRDANAQVDLCLNQDILELVIRLAKDVQRLTAEVSERP